MIVFAQLSDTHLDGSRRRAGRAAEVMAYLGGLPRPPEAVLVTGDITDHGRDVEYAQARELLSSPRFPVLTCPGNHDDRDAYRRVLLGEGSGAAGEDAGAPVNRAHRTPNALFALADSTIPGQAGGYLADETLDWLDAVLGEQPDRPAFVCCHHPPAVLHAPFVDDIRQSGEQRLAGVLARHPRVAAVLCGHAHTPAATTFAGRPLRVAPGVASTLVLPWEGDGLLDEEPPPGVAFHVLDDAGRLTTHYRVVSAGCSG